MPSTCATCRHWGGKRLRTYRDQFGVIGLSAQECRRHAPRMNRSGERWPLTDAEDNCGEFEPAPAEQLAERERRLAEKRRRGF